MLRQPFFLLSIVLQLSCFCCLGQQHVVQLDRVPCKCVYTAEQGRLTGPYVSFYNNGSKRCEGNLVNGYRTGRWIVWDSTGQKRMERMYKNPFEFTRIYPPIPNEGPIPLLSQNRYRLEYDSNGIIKYAKLKAENAIWRHKYWRRLAPANNAILFKDNSILKIFLDQLVSRSLTVFDITDDRFTTPLDPDKLLNEIGTQKIELVALELKEENIFDMERLVSEYRIIGICPIVKVNGETRSLFWVYYPDIRKRFGQEKLTINDPAIRSLDDLFTFRRFSSAIIKTTVDNPFDRFLKDIPGITASNMAKEQEAQELILIEEENNIWLGLTK